MEIDTVLSIVDEKSDEICPGWEMNKCAAEWYEIIQRWKMVEKKVVFSFDFDIFNEFLCSNFFEKYNDEAEKKNKNGPKLGTLGNVIEWTIG